MYPSNISWSRLHTDSACFLWGQSSEGSHTAERRGQVGHLVHIRVLAPGGHKVPSEEPDAGNGVEVVVLWGVVGALEHVEHSLRDEEAAADVDGGDECGGDGERLRRVRREVAAAHQQETAHGRDARDGVRYGHQRRVQSRGDAPHCVVTWNTHNINRYIGWSLLYRKQKELTFLFKISFLSGFFSWYNVL